MTWLMTLTQQLLVDPTMKLSPEPQRSSKIAGRMLQLCCAPSRCLS